MKKTLLMALLIMIYSCSSTKDKNQEPSAALQNLISGKEFMISSQWANPQMTAAMTGLGGLRPDGSIGGRVDIRGNTNYLKFENDSVSASLPYYGERQMGSSYTNIDQGINFKGVPEDLKIEQDGDAYKITFEIDDSSSGNEHYEVLIRLTSKLRSNIIVNSTHRNEIEYDGRVSTFKNDNKVTSL